MQEQELNIVEFKETFSKEWLDNKLRDRQIYGGVVSQLIPLRSGGYLLPRCLEQAVEQYIAYRYEQETGGVIPISTQEVYSIQENCLEGTCQGMYAATGPTTRC